MKMPNINYTGNVSKFVTADDNEYASILLYKDPEYFLDHVQYDKFIKNVERVVRTSPDYSNFVAYIKRVLGINFCQVSSKIYDTDATIEMHHGPLFTLYDIVETVLNEFIKTGQKITTFRVAKRVIEEHYALRVQVIMLSVTNHEAVHNKDIFLHLNQAIGNLSAFIKHYTPYLQDEQKYKIWTFINLCESSNFSKSFDMGLLDIDYVKKYVKL